MTDTLHIERVRNYDTALNETQVAQLTHDTSTFAERLLELLQGDRELSRDERAYAAWTAQVADLLLPQVNLLIVSKALPNLPIVERERLHDLDDLVDDRYMIGQGDAEGGVEKLDEAAQVLPLDEDEQALRKFLQYIVDETSYDGHAVHESYTDDFLNDQLQRTDVPEWLNDAIDWDQVYAKVVNDSMSVDAPNGGPTYYFLPSH